MMGQKAKIDWLRYSDGNNKYFHASMKARHQLKNIKNIQKSDGSFIHNQQELEKEVIDFYKRLMGTAATDLEGIDTGAMRDGAQLNSAQRDMLIMPVTKTEILKALKS